MASTGLPRHHSGSRLLLALTLASVLTGTLVSPALADPPEGSMPPASEPPGSVEIDVITGRDIYAEGVAVTAATFPHGGLSTVFLVSGEAYGDALAAAPLAAVKDRAVLFTMRTSLPTAVENELIRLAPANVVIVGGTTVIDDAVVTQVTADLAPGTVITRVAGSDLYGTAAALSAMTYPAGTGTVVVASGQDFPDAIVAGPVAARLRGPLLLTQTAGLTASTAAEITRLAPASVVIVGNTGQVSDAVATAIAALGPTVQRVSGSDRYLTAGAVAQTYWPAATAMVVATGLTFPDALAGVPLAAVRGVPILYLGPDEVPTATRDAILRSYPTRFHVMGNVSLILRTELGAWAAGRLTVPMGDWDYPAHDSLYHSYQEVDRRIHVLEMAYPNLVDAFSIGKSYQGREIWAAKISNNVSVDENEPEVLIDALHHAREHLGVEQALYLAQMLATDYSTDASVKALVDSREIWIIFALNPDGWAYDATRDPYRGWRKNQQPTPGSIYVGTDLNRNYGYKWGCCAGSSGNPLSLEYRGWAPFSATETQVFRDFVASRVINGRQQIRTHVTLHCNGQLILWPYGYTKTNIPSDMTVDDHSTFVKMAQQMAALNGYRAEQSSDLYVTDGDQIDWMYRQYRIFSFTWELYPSEQHDTRLNMYPPDTVIAPQTARNRGALLYLIDKAACPWAVIGKQSTYCP
jgi:putative cell wall-binding protein/murein tripeptide amidase MpaA